MQNIPVNNTPIQQFINIVKSAELNHKNEVKLPIQQAKMLVYNLTELLAVHNSQYANILQTVLDKDSTTIKLNLDGGSF